MGKELRTRLYIAGVWTAAVAVAAVAAQTWATRWEASPLLVIMAIAGLVFVIDRYPIKLSPQADASLFTVPIYMGVLLLHPTHAAIAAGLGVLASEAMQRRPFKPLAFNVGSGMLAAGLGGMALYALKPGVGLTLVQGRVFLAAMAAALTLEAVNLLVAAGIVSVRKGSAFWDYWKGAWAFETV